MSKNRNISISALFLCIVITVYVQIGFLNERFQEKSVLPGCPWCEEGKGDDVLFIPLSASIMSIMAPADDDFIADLLWMRLTYYFGLHSLTNREYPYLLHLFDLVTDLSPRWDLPYKMGAILLPMEADALEDGLYLIDKGLVHLPKDWELYFYKGFYLFYYLNDNVRASEILFQASLLSDAPGYLARLSATIANRSGHKEVALRFLNEALRNISDPRQRKMVLDKLSEVAE